MRRSPKLEKATSELGRGGPDSKTSLLTGTLQRIYLLINGYMSPRGGGGVIALH
jgi:hypothetical protein